MSAFFFFTPTAVVYFSVLFQTLYLILYTLDLMKNRRFQFLKWLMNNILILSYFLFGVLCLYTGIIMLSMSWSYIDWRYQLPSVILALITGTYYTIAIILRSKAFHVLYFLPSACIFVFLFIMIFPGIIRALWMGLIGIITLLLVQLFFLLYRYYVQKSNIHWLNYRLFKKNYTFRNKYWTLFNWILWALIVTESILKLSGLSLFIWW